MVNIVYLCIVDKQSTYKYSKNETIRASSIIDRNGKEPTGGRGCESAYRRLLGDSAS